MLLWKRISQLTITKVLRMAFGSTIQLANADGTVTEIDLSELAALNSIGEADLAKIDGVVNGTGAAGKALVLDANGAVTVPGEVKLNGNVNAAAGAGITGGVGTVFK